MYRLRFERSDGETILLDYEHGYLISRTSGETGINTELGIAQGYSQVGTTVSTAKAVGTNFVIQGYILDKNTSAKKKMLSIISPQSHGRLVWNDEYFVEAWVKNSPSMTQEKHSRFSMMLYVPFPFWQKITKNSYKLGSLEPEFRFPINYSIPHRFGTRNVTNSVTIINNGDVDVSYEMWIIAGSSGLVNPRVINYETNEEIKFDIEMASGDVLQVFRVEGELEVTLTHLSVTTNAFDCLSDESTFFKINKGSSLVGLSADGGASQADVIIEFYETTVGVLADGV